MGAKAEIHRLMGELAQQGMAIIMISSELPEILGMSDRIAVMHGGTIVGTVERAGAIAGGCHAMALGTRGGGRDEARAVSTRAVGGRCARPPLLVVLALAAPRFFRAGNLMAEAVNNAPGRRWRPWG